MKEYDVFSDPEFKANCVRDQILYSHTIKIECAWCKADMGVKPCNEEQRDKISHSICKSCKIKMEKEIFDYEEVI